MGRLQGDPGIVLPSWSLLQFDQNRQLLPELRELPVVHVRSGAVLDMAAAVAERIPGTGSWGQLPYSLLRAGLDFSFPSHPSSGSPSRSDHQRAATETRFPTSNPAPQPLQHFTFNNGRTTADGSRDPHPDDTVQN